jgi:hypothetical protein
MKLLRPKLPHDDADAKLMRLDNIRRPYSKLPAMRNDDPPPSPGADHQTPEGWPKSSTGWPSKPGTIQQIRWACPIRAGAATHEEHIGRHSERQASQPRGRAARR